MKFHYWAAAVLVCGLCTASLSADKAAEKNTLAFELGDDTMTLFDGETPVWNYVFRQKTNSEVPSEDPRRTAGGYFHPLYGLHGETLTANATLNDNHAHHHGLWCSFTTVILHRTDGTDEPYDTWTDNTALKKEFVEWGEKTCGPKNASMTVKNGWFINGQEKIMDETMTVVTGAPVTDPELGRFRIFDVAWEWQPVREKITLAGDRAYQKNFASAAIRFIPPKSKPLVRSEKGEIADDAMIQKASWLDYQDDFAGNGAPSGVAILPSSKNPPYDGGMAIRHYGLLATGWPGLAGRTIAPGEPPVKIEYRIIIHEKPWDVDQIQRKFEEYRSESGR